MRRITAGLLALVILISMSTVFAASAGTPSDPLVTLSYLESDIIPELNGAVNKVVSAYVNDNTYIAQAQRMYNTASARIIPEGYSFASSYLIVKAPRGSSVTLLTGGSFMLISGDVKLVAERGEVININTAAVAFEDLDENTRYFATEDTVARYTASRDSICLISGAYSLENGASIVTDVYFSDLSEEDGGFEAAVELYNRGIVSCVSGTSFEPETDITIGTVIEALWILAGRPDENAESWANENDIWTYDDPENIVTHEELAYILYRYAEFSDMDTESNFNISEYDDYEDVAPEYRDAIAWAFENGILTGSIDSVLEPDDHTTRIQAVMAIYSLTQI